MALSRRPYETWYGWEGDRLTTTQTAQSRVQTVYGPGSFTPLVRIETDSTEQAKARHCSLAEKLEQEGSEDGQAVQFPAALRAMLDRLEGELKHNAVSEESRAWLAGCGLTPEQMAGQLEPHDEPKRKLHLYHCDHRGLPLALITPDNQVAWRGEYDEWGNLQSEDNPNNLQQLIRLPGQQYDEESGLYYNRHRYYNPGLGRYITQDPIGLKGGWNLNQYPLNPVQLIDPLGLIGNWGEFMSESLYRNNISPNEISKIYTTPYPGSFSADIGFALDAFGGGSLVVGMAAGGNANVPTNLDLCAYYTLCDHSGIGYAAGLAISGTASNATISPGDYHTKGFTSSGGFLGKYSVTGVKDADSKYSGTISAGPGIGTYTGAVTCSQTSRCLSQLFGY